MTTQEIQAYIREVIEKNFSGYSSDSGEMMTGADGDGRFMGKVIAVRYSRIRQKGDIFLAIGATDKGIQIIKFGASECLTPSKVDLNVLLQKEIGVKFEIS